MRLALIGLNYGLAYLPALRAFPELDLVALGARGSERSLQVADELDLPLFLDVASLLAEARPDAAIVAVPSYATAEVAEALLAARCHVLCELPLEGDEAEALVARARATGVHFAVNPHFPHLRAPAEFVRRARSAGRPAVVDVVCHERTLYPCLDTVRRAFGVPFVPTAAVDGVAIGAIGAARAAVRVTPLTSEYDDGSDVYFGMRISAGFAATSQALTLVDTFGPVLSGRITPPQPREVLPATRPRSVGGERKEANRTALRAFVRGCRNPVPDQAIVEVARSYSATVERLLAAR